MNSLLILDFFLRSIRQNESLKFVTVPEQIKRINHKKAHPKHFLGTLYFNAFLQGNETERLRKNDSLAKALNPKNHRQKAKAKANLRF